MYKTIALRIVGQWHYYNQSGFVTFSLISSVGESGTALIAKGDRQYSATYRISFVDDSAVIVSIEGLPDTFKATIKVLTNDSLILQHHDSRLEILQRMPDVKFADSVIEGL